MTVFKWDSPTTDLEVLIVAPLTYAFSYLYSKKVAV